MAAQSTVAGLRQQADTTRDETLRAGYLTKLGIALLKASSPDSALLAFEQSQQIAQRLNLQQLMGFNQMYQGNIAYLKGQPERSLDLQQAAYKQFEAIGDSMRMAWCIGNAANVYMTLSRFEDAIESNYKAKEILTKFNDSLNIATSQMNIGTALYSLSKFNEALILLDSAILYFEQDDFPSENLCQCYQAKGRCLEQSGRQPEALGYYLKALQLARKGQYKYVTGEIYNSLFAYFINKKDYESARKYINEALALFEPLGYTEGICYSLESLGEWHLRQEQFDEAVQVLEQGIEIARNAQVQHSLKSLLIKLSEVYKQHGNAKKARFYREQAEAIGQ